MKNSNMSENCKMQVKGYPEPNPSHIHCHVYTLTEKKMKRIVLEMVMNPFLNESPILPGSLHIGNKPVVSYSQGLCISHKLSHTYLKHILTSLIRLPGITYNSDLASPF